MPKAFFQTRLAHGILPRLAWLGPDHSACSPDSITRKRSTGYRPKSAAAAFVEYAVSTYGRDRLPALIDGMNRYDTWEDAHPRRLRRQRRRVRGRLAGVPFEG